MRASTPQGAALGAAVVDFDCSAVAARNKGVSTKFKAMPHQRKEVDFITKMEQYRTPHSGQGKRIFTVVRNRHRPEAPIEMRHVRERPRVGFIVTADVRRL